MVVDVRAERRPARTPPRGRGRRYRSEEDFEAWLAEVTERLDPFMAWLGVVFALLVGYELAVELGSAAARAVSIAGWVIWAVFALEFGAKLWLAPRRLRFLKRHWLQTAGLLIPTLRVLRFLRLVRLGRALPAARVLSASYRGLAPARQLLRSRLGYLAAVSVVGSPRLSSPTCSSATAATRPSTASETRSSGASRPCSPCRPTRFPESAGARIVMLVGFGFGLVIVASLAGTLGAFLVEGRREREGPVERR
jgi:voltage-gated potassium channel